MARHEAIVKVAQRGDAQIVFIGASIVQFFAGEPDTGGGAQNRGKDTWDLYYGADHAINLGISGDRTQNMLWRLDHGALGNCHPKVAVLNCGNNNIGSNTPDEITAGVEAVCERVQTLSPGTKVLLTAIFPHGSADSQWRGPAAQINASLAKWAPKHNVDLVDINYAFIKPNGDLPTAVMPDLLHPSSFGYRKWAMAMEPELARLMHRRPKTTLDPNNTAVVPVPQNRDFRSYNWMTRFAATKQYALDHTCRLAFLGDSIIHHFGGPPLDRGLTATDPVWQKFYGDRDAVDLGFGWDRTENVLWRLEQGELDDMPLQAVTLMIGTNNLEFNSPVEIRDGVRAIVNLIRTKKPRAKILLLAIFPRGERADDPNRLRAIEVNKLIAPLGRQRNVTFTDIGAKFLEPDGMISRDVMGDFLHPTDRGYEIWGGAIEPWIKANTTVAH
jgi:lysophospholipase L1-like esterase